ncbi:unnamed protein product [Caenorhabditis brenneri]
MSSSALRLRCGQLIEKSVCSSLFSVKAVAYNVSSPHSPSQKKWTVTSASGSLPPETDALTPRMLPSCGHTLCEECGVKLLANGQLACPFDRTVNDLKNGSIKTLPKNFAILELLENTPAPNPAPANPDPLRIRNPDAPPVRNPEESHVASHNDDALDGDIDPVFLQEMLNFQNPPDADSPGTLEPRVEDSEDDDEIPVEEYLYNLQLEDNEDPEQAADGPEEGRHVASDNDDALDDDIDPELLQEIFDPGPLPDAASPGIPGPEGGVEDSEDDEISVEEYMYNLGLESESYDDSSSSDGDEDPWMK